MCRRETTSLSYVKYNKNKVKRFKNSELIQERQRLSSYGKVVQEKFVSKRETSELSGHINVARESKCKDLVSVESLFRRESVSVL